MIEIFGVDVSPNNTGLLATKITARVVESLEVPIDECSCICGCEPYQKVFANPGGEWWENDITSFLFKRVTASDTITMQLYRNDSLIGTLNNNTYGTFYDFGSLDDSDCKGYKLEWEKVFNSLGYGIYYIKTTIVSLGDTIIKESLKYECMEYSNIRACGTVRVETYQNGYIMNNFIDHTGMNWYQSYRIEGVFGYKKPTFETDNYQNSVRDITQIQDKITNIYTLETKMLPSNLLNAITYDGLLANKILITDYNFCNFERYKRLSVYPDSIEDFQTWESNPHGTAIFKFTDKRQNIIKRNFY